jgi:hypothetical protein
VARPLTVHVLEPGEESAWQDFLERSSNSTLFHDLRFLAYHPPGRFHFHHLVVRNGSQIVSVIPGGVIENAEGVTWRSPIGASIGGPVLPSHRRLSEVLAIVEAVQEHARRERWMGIEMTLPPAVYHPRIGDVTGFALFRQGFHETRRWLCPMIDLAAAPADVPAVETVFERRQLQALRAAVRRGSMAFETGVEGLEDFRPVFDETYARHGTRPTHTIDEVATLLSHFPDRVRLMLTRQDECVTAGLLVMRLTSTVAATTYICSSTRGLEGSGAVVALAELIVSLRRTGCRWLDLGPSASESTLNAGVMLFKEGLGGVGYCRNQWSWTVSP